MKFYYRLRSDRGNPNMCSDFQEDVQNAVERRQTASVALPPSSATGGRRFIYQIEALATGYTDPSNSALAASYTVGDSSGWKFNVAGWENGKNFVAGDTLVFKYSVGVHNVVIVDKSSFDSCTAPPNAKTFSSGNDQIALAKGPNYFICGIPGHCQSGMKIAANTA